MNVPQPLELQRSFMQGAMEGLGLDIPKRAHLAAFMVGVGATLGFIYYDETISPTGHTSVESQPAAIAQDVADETLVEEAVHRGLSALTGGFLVGLVTTTGMAMMNRPRDESAL